MTNWEGFGRKQFYPKFTVLPRQLAGSTEDIHDLLGMGIRSVSHLTTMFYMNVHLLCSTVAAPGALHYLQMSSFMVHNLWTSLDLLS